MPTHAFAALVCFLGVALFNGVYPWCDPIQCSADQVPICLDAQHDVEHQAIPLISTQHSWCGQTSLYVVQSQHATAHSCGKSQP